MESFTPPLARLRPFPLFLFFVLLLPSLRADDPIAFPPETNATTIADGARSPKLIKRVEPTPPPECANLKHPHRIFIAFVVDSNGRVQNASALFGPLPALAKSAIEAVQQWEFEPAVHPFPFANGIKLMPVNAQMTVLIHFAPSASTAGK